MTILDQITLAFNEYKLTRKEVNTIFAPLCVYHNFLEDLGYYVVSAWDHGSLYYGNFKFQLLNEYNYDDEYLQREIEYAKS